MSTVVCPRCSCRQPDGDVCRICDTRLPKEETRYSAAPPAAVERTTEPQQAPGKTPPGLLRRIWRISNWLTLGALIVILALILWPAPAPVIHVDPQAMVRAEAKVRESQAAASSGQPTALRLDEAELNAFLASNLRLEGAPNTVAAGAGRSPEGPAGQGGTGASTADNTGGSTASNTGGSAGGSEPSLDEVRSNVRDVKVTMQDDRVQAYVLFDFHGKDLTLVLEGHLAAKDGYLRFIPTSGKIGSLPIPQSTLEGAVQRMLDSPENRDKLRLPDGVGDVRIENGQLVVAPKE